jgi:hypothetical protein
MNIERATEEVAALLAAAGSGRLSPEQHRTIAERVLAVGCHDAPVSKGHGLVDTLYMVPEDRWSAECVCGWVLAPPERTRDRALMQQELHALWIEVHRAAADLLSQHTDLMANAQRAGREIRRLHGEPLA